MKKLAVLLIVFISIIMPLRARAQSVNWVALQSDTTTLAAPGQSIQLSLNGAFDTPINGAGLILRYDPACFKITGHQAGSLMAGATPFVQEKPGQYDLLYFYLGKGKGLTGEGSLITIQLESLQLCASELSVAPETITLGVLDENGMAFNLPGVEYRSLATHFTPGAGLMAVTPQAAAAVAETPEVNSTAPIIQSTVPVTQPEHPKNSFSISLVIMAFVFIFLPVIIAAIYFLLRRLSKQPGKSSAPITASGPALILDGRSIPLPNERTPLGRYAEIVRRDGVFYLSDSGSQKGIFLNRKRLAKGYYPLHNGDQVQLGQDISYRFVESRGQTFQSI
jgi:hypothetical protein